MSQESRVPDRKNVHELGSDPDRVVESERTLGLEKRGHVHEHFCDQRLVTVPIEMIRISPFQPRRQFSDRELQELADSIATVGLIHPPVVRAIKKGEQVLYYELIAGERRWRACMRAKRETLPVLVRDYDDAQAAQSSLIENVQRVDLNPIEMAHAFKRLIDVFRMTQEEVAQKVGKQRSTVTNYLRLLTLSEQMQGAIAQGEISMGHAKALLAVEGQQQEELKERICQQQLSVREAEQVSRQMQREHPTADLKAIEQRLTEHVHARVTVHHLTTGAGKIVIHYQNFDDLERLLEQLQAGSEESSCCV